jgi:hypothetical protein
MESTNAPREQEVYAASEFKYFSILPTEIQRAIWRACLPRRIVPIAYGMCPGDGFLRTPPAISRVCQQARSVAFEHGALRWSGNLGLEKFAWQRVWFDTSTDLVFINDSCATQFANISQEYLTDHLLSFAKKAGVVVVSYSFFTSISIFNMKVLLDALGSPSLIIAMSHTCHITYDEANQSGLFGRDAEEMIALVDVYDRKRIRVCADHLTKRSTESEGFVMLLQNHLESSHGYEYLLNLQKQQLEDRWLQLRKDKVPNFKHAMANSYFAGLYNQFGFLNRDHHLVKEALESFPKHKFMFAFQRCQWPFHMLVMDKLVDGHQFNRVCRGIRRKGIFTVQMLREYFSKGGTL